MKKLFVYKLFLLLLIVFISGCSTKKNTWSSRFYQATNTRYNVLFNGVNSYNEGLKSIQKANQEDYSTIIPMYPISHHSNAKSAIQSMDRTIEKCRKAIKLHSIKIKPIKNYKKANLPEYKLFYDQQEFNPALKEAWLLLAQAQFHKADFLGSAATFSYVARLYNTDKEIETVCQLWIIRAYAEMGWIYEAEQVLSKLDQNNLKSEDIGLFASVNADLLLKKHQYKEAIPFLALALTKEKDKDLKQRFNFLLAQLYQKTGNDKSAYDAYSAVIKMNPPYEMDFNARINRAQLDRGNVVSVRKDLQKMLRNPNNKDYLDQLYFALAKTYLNRADTLKAIENYKLSIEKSTRNGIDKALTLITLGDLYYFKKKYILAQPCYDDASKIITNEQNDYERVTNRAETLSELVVQNNTVELQDSLQRLAAMPESKRLEVVNKLIEKLIADEKEAAKKQLEKANNSNNNENFANQPPIGGNLPGAAGDWYFYNPNLIRSGQSDFQKKWGNRKLEDNWRRTNKAVALFADDTSTSNPDVSTTDTLTKKAAVTTDVKDPAFYLKQIPVTASQIASSNAEIATGLYNMGLIFKDKIQDMPMAISTFETFIKRFEKDERVPDAYFQLYLIETKLGNKAETEHYRTRLMNEFPDSKYQKILSQPDYASRQEKMYVEQDSIYDLTYKAFNKNAFDTVFNNVAFIQKNYPLSTLMPKFLFLNALSIGKSNTSDKFEIALEDLVKNYPQSDVSAMSKDILGLLKQGREARVGTSGGSLIVRRDLETKTENTSTTAELKFSTDKQTKHRLLLITSTTAFNMNKLQYNIASYNFSRFMIKDFDLIITKLDSLQSVLSVTNFESFDETDWYAKSLLADATISKLLSDFNVQEVVISEDNYALMKTSFNLNDYLAFLNNQALVKVSEPAVITKATKKQEKATLSKENNVKTDVNLLPKEDVKNLPPQKVDKTLAKPDEKSLVELTEKKQPENNIPTPKVESVNSQPTNSISSNQPKVEEPPLFKGLFTYRSIEPYFVAIYILSGTIDFEKIKKAFDAYNIQNYGIMNLKVSLETVDKQQVIIIGSMSDAYVAKSYLIRMVKEKNLFEGLKNASYRNLLGSQKNLNIMMQQNAMKTYFEFMQEYYLK